MRTLRVLQSGLTLAVILLGWRAAWAAETYDLRKYLPMNQGDSWTYEHKQGGRTTTDDLVVTVQGTKEIGGSKFMVRKQTNGVIDYYKHSAKGVELAGGKAKSPIGLIDWSVATPIIYPAACKLAQPYIQKMKGKSGPKLPLMPLAKNLNMTCTFTALDEETVKTPARKFEKCLRCKIVIDAGKVLGTESKTVRTMWLAKGIGEVKAEITYGDGETHYYVLKSAEKGE